MLICGKAAECSLRSRLEGLGQCLHSKAHRPGELKACNHSVFTDYNVKRDGTLHCIDIKGRCVEEP